MGSEPTTAPSIKDKEPKKVKVDFMNWALGGPLLSSSNRGGSRKVIVTDSKGRSKIVDGSGKSEGDPTKIKQNDGEAKKPDEVSKPAEPGPSKKDPMPAASEEKKKPEESKPAELKKKDEVVVVVVVEEGQAKKEGKATEKGKSEGATETSKKNDKPAESKKDKPPIESEKKDESSNFTNDQDTKILSMKADNKSWKDISSALSLPKKDIIARWKERSNSSDHISGKDSDSGKKDDSNKNKEKEKEPTADGEAFKMSGALNNDEPTTSKDTPAVAKTTETVTGGEETTIEITTTITSPKKPKKVNLITLSTTTSTPKEKEPEKPKPKVTILTTPTKPKDSSTPKVQTPKPTPTSPPPPSTELLCNCPDCETQTKKTQHRVSFSDHSEIINFPNYNDGENPQGSNAGNSQSQNQSRGGVEVYQGRLRPNEIWTREDCEILEVLEGRYKDNKWLEVQAAFFNWTGKMIDGEVIRGKFEGDGAV